MGQAFASAPWPLAVAWAFDWASAAKAKPRLVASSWSPLCILWIPFGSLSECGAAQNVVHHVFFGRRFGLCCPLAAGLRCHVLQSGPVQCCSLDLLLTGAHYRKGDLPTGR